MSRVSFQMSPQVWVAARRTHLVISKLSFECKRCYHFYCCFSSFVCSLYSQYSCKEMKTNMQGLSNSIRNPLIYGFVHCPCHQAFAGRHSAIVTSFSPTITTPFFIITGHFCPNFIFFCIFSSKGVVFDNYFVSLMPNC